MISNFDKNLERFNSSVFFAKNKFKNNKLDNHANQEIPVNEPNTIEMTNSDFDICINQCPDFACISKKLNTKSTHHNLFLQRECIDLRFKYYQQLSNTKYIIKPNLNATQIHNILEYIKFKPFKIIQCDKNIGAAIISDDLLNRLSTQHLSKTDTYLKLEENPLNSTCLLITNTINTLVQTKDLSQSLANKLLPINCKPGKFRILAKLHKEKFGIRPIVNSVDHPTSRLCQLIELILQPLVTQTESYLKDSQQLLQICENLCIKNNNVYIYSCDFDSLYTNIDKNEAIHRITDFVKDRLDIKYITPNAFNTILLLIFENNIFNFNTSYYLQVNGLAMGCICGPSIANMFIYLLEKHWMTIHKPLVYRRYIDDILLILIHKLDVDKFTSQFLNLRLNIVHSKIVNFLDLNISYDILTCKLNFSLYIKKTNTFQYLVSTSNHPNFIFSNIPKSLFLRIRRICTSYTDYLFFARKLIFQLLQRGYCYKKLISTSVSIGNIDRKNLLPYKSKTNFTSNTLWLKHSFSISHPNNNDLIIKESFTSLQDDYCWMHDTKLLTCNSISDNLMSIFVFNKAQFFTSRSFQTKTCKVINCETCQYVSNKSYFLLKKLLCLIDKNKF